MIETYFYEPPKGHGLRHNPFKAIIAPRGIGRISTRQRRAHQPHLQPQTQTNRDSQSRAGARREREPPFAGSCLQRAHQWPER
jgi:hypothetical protein